MTGFEPHTVLIQETTALPTEPQLLTIFDLLLTLSILLQQIIFIKYFFIAGGESVLLSAGIHSFPFKLGLPLGLPSTFLGKHGWVQYFCKAALREETGLTHKNQQVFIIMNPIDLNLEPPILAVSCSALDFLANNYSYSYSIFGK